jgi:hypothetical protein
VIPNNEVQEVHPPAVPERGAGGDRVRSGPAELAAPPGQEQLPAAGGLRLPAVRRRPHGDPGGYGIYIDDLTADIFAAFLVRHGPFNFNEGFTNAITAGVPLLTFDRPFLDFGTRLGNLDVRGMDWNLRNPYTQQWNFTLEREVGSRTGVRLSYIGTRPSGRPTAATSTSHAEHGAVHGGAPAVTASTEILFNEANGNQIYHAVSLNVERRMHRGLYFQANHTIAKMLTDTEDGSEGGPTMENPYDRSGFRGDSQWVPRHRFIGNLIWELPVGRGRQLLNRPGPVDWILGGWQISSTYVAQTGEYLTPRFSGADPSNTDNLRRVADRIGNGNLPSSQRTIDGWFDASAFALPPNGRFGNGGRGVIIGPGRQSVNLGVFKSFHITERSTIRVQGTATNALNRPVFGNPNLDISVPAAVGRIQSVQTRDFGGPREVMLGVRFDF